MQSFKVISRGWSAWVLAILAGGGVLVLVAAAFLEPLFLIPAAGWAILVRNGCWNAVRSIASGPVIIDWDGERLVVRPSRSEPLVQIDAAQWVYTDGSNIVLRTNKPTRRFNSGHVRCNGRELIVDGILGSSAPQGLRTVVHGIGPRKQFLWRYFPI